ncbi:prophage tail fiber N-terminal domain-containing protein [Escherichia coli]|uniref:prophage tail fiber N-terminal domain-containing protein n=1 Tax=Escherichia coli TaxID=562 RepID=UPI00287B269B|nr:prophage tail fiber N-terminal domain-containing protein [Escherichia coli]MDS1455394.1 prophage tail fiber N-terminal domain-containing protein [Escherichia coli]
MAVKISGVLKDGAGKPVVNCAIELRARRTSPTVVAHVVATCVTDNNGAYVIEAEPGYYEVALHCNGWQPTRVGDIDVAPTDAPGTLNAFLNAPKDGDLRPEVMKRFEEMVAQAQQSAGAAAGNAQQTAQDVAAAAGYARAAEQAKNDIDAALTGTLKTANHLSEIAAAGEKAQQKSRDNLGLKSAATMEAQSDIYDRTKGRLAIPGAFGFGRAFLPEDVIRFDTKSDFLAWVRNALPGEYSVAGPYDIIIPDTRFEGVLSIRWTDARPETTEPRYRAKSLTFYGINGPIYHTRYCYWPISRLTGWVKINITTEDIIYRIVASSVRNRWGDPDIGGLIIAAYQGEADGDKVIRLVRGQSYRGSRLGPVGISVPSTPTGTYIASPQFFITGCSEHSLPGSYCALSGVPDAHVSGAMPGLFIRTS